MTDLIAAKYPNLIAIVKTGSQILIDEPTDFDYWAIVEGDKISEKIRGNGWEAWVRSQDVIEDYVYMREGASLEDHTALFNFFYLWEPQVVWGTYNKTYELCEWYLEFVRYLYQSTFATSFNRYKFSKFFVYYYIAIREGILNDQDYLNIRKLYKKTDNYEELIDEIHETLTA